MVNLNKTSVIATAMFVLFALAVVPAAATWNLNFTVAYPNGTGINTANVTVYLETPPNVASLNGTFQADVNQTNSSSLANVTIITDSATALYSLRVLASTADRPGGFVNYVSPTLPPMPKAVWLSFLEGKTLRLVPALNIYMIAFNDTFDNATAYVWPNGTTGNYNGTIYASGTPTNTLGNGSASLWDIFSTDNGTGFTNNIRFNFTSFNVSSGGLPLKNNTQGTGYAYVIFDRTKGIPLTYLKTSNNVTNLTFLPNSVFSQHNKTVGIGDTRSPGMAPGQVAVEVLPLDRNYTILFYSITGESPPRAVNIINPATNSSINLTARSLASPT